MFARRILAAVALLCAIIPAHAQKTKSVLTTEINTNWPDNSSGSITPAILRSTVLDIVNSYYDLNGGSSLSCAANQWIAALPTLSSITCSQPAISNLSGLGTGVATFLGTPSSANLAAALTTETGSGLVVFNNAPSLISPVITGSPSGAGTIISINSTNCQLGNSCTIATGSIAAGTTIVNGGPGVLSNASSGGVLVSSLALPSGLSATNMTLTTPALGTPTAITLTNGTGLPISTGLTGAGTGVITALGVNVGTAGSFVVNGGALGTPSSAVLTNATGLPMTTGVTGILGLANGGSNANLAASNGGIVYSGASALAILAGTGTAGQCLLSGSNAAPTWGSCSGAAAVSSVSNSDSTLTVSPTTGAVVASLNLGHANTWTAAQTFTDSDFLLKGSTSGAMTLKAPAVASSYVMTFPATTDTVAVLGTAQTFTAAQTFTNSDFLLLGSSTGATTFTSTNASSTNYTLSFPAVTSTVAVLSGVNQTFTANETFSGTVNHTGGFQVNGNTMTFPAASVTLASLGNASLQANPTAPTGTSSGALTMMGLGSTCKLTPNYSGRILVLFNGSMTNSSTGGQVQSIVRWGTGTAPANGASATGTSLGALTNGYIATATGQVPFSNGGIITGLTPGTAYWFDEGIQAIVSGTASLTAVSCAAMEF
jgi:hypothetical protein